MTKTGKIGMLLAVVMVLVAGSAMANPAGPDPKAEHKAACAPDKGNGGEDGFVFDGLNLTPQQIDLLKTHKVEKQKSMVKLRADLETLQVDLAAASSDNKPDMAKIETLTHQMGEIHGKMIAERVKSIIYLRSILTDEQKKTLDAKGLRMDWGMGMMNRERGSKREHKGGQEEER